MKNNILHISIFLSGAVFGGAVMGMWQKTHTPVCPAAQCPQKADLLLAQLEQAGLPDDVRLAQDEETQLKKSSDIPSQLSPIELPEGVDLSSIGVIAPAQKSTSTVALNDQQNTLVLNAQKPAEQAADGSAITMIEAPVQAKRIKTLDEYKAFKRTAQGSYPAADFAKEDVLVLESVSNLPDKVFEIVAVEPAADHLLVVYRVNVLGLDKKTNSHSAQKITKSKLPVVLKQVL